MNAKMYKWNKKSTPEELHPMLSTIAEEYPVVENGAGDILTFIKHKKGLKIQYRAKQIFVYYDIITSAARGVGTILGGAGKTDEEVVERLPFETFGVLLDCSRNAVFKVEYVKKWLRRLALMGYNMVMLYTKDTYKLPDEDFFGYLRGGYTIQELRKIDDYASKLGIEMVGSIQALGHLEPVLRWPAYQNIKDTSSVLLTTEKKTYELIDKMLDFYSAAFKSRRIHLGMDETHDLGRGRYMDLNGYKRGFDIYNEHLRKISEKCKKRGLSYMMWSDMFFRMGSKTQDYYDDECIIPETVKEQIPRDAKLVYWDYYHEDEDFYGKMIRRHKKLGFTPVMASAIWVCKHLWYNHDKTIKTAPLCIDACIKENVKEIFFCTWGDDGIFFDYDSAQAGFCYVAEKAYSGVKDPDEEKIANRFEAVCGGNYLAHITASEITSFDKEISALYLLWDDFLLGIYWKNQKHICDNFWHKVHQKYRKIETELLKTSPGNAGDIKHILQVIKILNKKIELKLEMDSGYFNSNPEQLRKVKDMIPELIKDIDDLIVSFRLHWNSRYKRFGFEIINIRLGGQKERLHELSLRLEEFIDKQEPIPELEETAYYPGFNPLDFAQLATGTHFV